MELLSSLIMVFDFSFSFCLNKKKVLQQKQWTSFFHFLLLDQKKQKSRRKAISIFSSLKEPSQFHQKNMYIAPFRQNQPHYYQCMRLFI